MSNVESGMTNIGEQLSSVIKKARSGIDYGRTDTEQRSTRATRIQAIHTKMGELAAEIELLKDESERDGRTLYTGATQLDRAAGELASMGVNVEYSQPASEAFVKASGFGEGGLSSEDSMLEATSLNQRSSHSMGLAIVGLASVRAQLETAAETAAEVPRHIDESTALCEEGISQVKRYAETIGVSLTSE